MQPLPAAATPAPATPSCTPLLGTPRRPNVPLHIREWILSKVNQFQYHEKGIRTKEEKQVFIMELSKKLNERYSSETGPWDEARTGTFVRNSKKSKVESTRVPSPSITTSTTAVKSPMEQLLMDWQAVLQTSSRLNSSNLARHPSDRGSCNEDLIKGFLSSVLSSRFIGIGSGEIFTSGKKRTRQLDIVLYNPDYPCLRPARFGGNALDGCCCFYEESVMLIIEVKTTLTNQDLSDVGLAASMLPSHIPLLIFSFDSQSTLKAIDTSHLPENVKGIFTLSHGSLVKTTSSNWEIIHPSQQTPLVKFYVVLLQQLLEYALQQAETSGAFLHVLETLLNQVSSDIIKARDEQETDENHLCHALRELDFHNLKEK